MKYTDAEKPNAVELAKDIVATLTNFIVFTEPDEVDNDYAERIKKSRELLVYDENMADKKAVKEMMDSLNEKIAKATESWKGVDVDEFMDEMRGREPDMDLHTEVEKYFQGLWPGMETAEQCNTDMHFTPPAIMRLARHFYELGFKARK